MAEARTKVLIYAVRGSVVAKYCGQLALVVAILMLPPMVTALFHADYGLAFRYALLGVGLLLVGGLLARMHVPERIQGNEAMTVTALAFLFTSFLMSWPMMEQGVSFLDALFESISGITTTGLSTLGGIERRSNTFLFARSWMQWYGGLGFIVLSVALLLGHHSASRRLFGTVEGSESLMMTARTHALRTLIVYVSLTFLGLLVVWPLTGDGFTSLLHVLSAVSTGGFSSHDTSLAGLGSRPAAVAVIAISFLSAVSLHLYWKIFHSGWKGGAGILLADIELRTLLLACMVSGTLLSVLAWFNHVENPWYQGFTMGFSAQTTTGFSTVQVASMDPASKLVMILSMMVGGSVGSSAGGFKILRLLIMLRLLQLLLRRTAMPPHAVAEPFLGDQKLEPDETGRALQLILLFMMVILLSWVPFVVMGYDPLNALFEVVSACGTVGLSSGIARPELEPFLKAILCFDMLAGRLEVVALLVILYPRNWIGRREEAS